MFHIKTNGESLEPLQLRRDAPFGASFTESVLASFSNWSHLLLPLYDINAGLESHRFRVIDLHSRLKGSVLPFDANQLKPGTHYQSRVSLPL